MFITEDFLLQSDAAARLYHEYAAQSPIADYHNHLPPQDIAENRQFENLHDIWLAGDHYKWRAMRTNGFEERLCSGDADPREKFDAWAETMPATLCNPLYHWSHLELKRYFGIDEMLNPANADSIWEAANERLAEEQLSVRGILQKFDVRVLCTTDDPADDLTYHDAIAKAEIKTKVLPTFRPDNALRVGQPQDFIRYMDRLGTVADREIACLSDLVDVLKSRHDHFHQHGCRLSDHGLEHCDATFVDESTVATIFDKARSGQQVSPTDQSAFVSFMMLQFARWNRQRDWTQQLHLGAIRNVSTKSFSTLGRDMGFDSIGDFSQAQSLGAFLAKCEMEEALPRTIIYNNNPAQNYVFATMASNFQDGTKGGRVQFGAAWWFLDTKYGMEEHLRTLASVGLLSRFVGMLTDSRSFMSFPRHEYFRRVLCNFVGGQMTCGELPNDYDLVGQMIRDICFQNTIDYLQLR